jgi:uncharacterized MAPEG superfamily protein
MDSILNIVVFTTLLTFASVLLGAFLRNREWTAEGLKAGLSNRDNLPEATPLGGRAERAAANSLEASIFFVPLALVAHLSGNGAEALLGAQIFFWARVAYLPIYLVGITVVRSLVWGVGVFGMAMMVLAIL